MNVPLDSNSSANYNRVSMRPGIVTTKPAESKAEQFQNEVLRVKQDFLIYSKPIYQLLIPDCLMSTVSQFTRYQWAYKIAACLQ